MTDLAGLGGISVGKTDFGVRVKNSACEYKKQKTRQETHSQTVCWGTLRLLVMYIIGDVLFIPCSGLAYHLGSCFFLHYNTSLSCLQTIQNSQSRNCVCARDTVK